MASYSADRAKHATLTANTVDTVTLGSNWSWVEVVNWGASNRIYVTTDGTTPTVGGDDTGIVGPNGAAIMVFTPEPEPTVVKLICAGANEYSVTGS